MFKIYPRCGPCQYFFFYCWIIYHCMDMLHFLHIDQLVDIRVVSTFWLFWLLLLWTFTDIFLCGHMFLSGFVDLRVDFLGHVVVLCLVFEKLPDCFPKWLHHFPFLPARYEGSSFSTSSSVLSFYYSCPSGCDREGDGTPLQYSRLENPRDRGAWWVAVYGVAQSRTRLKRLSSSSSSGCEVEWKGF